MHGPANSKRDLYISGLPTDLPIFAPHNPNFVPLRFKIPVFCQPSNHQRALFLLGNADLNEPREIMLQRLKCLNALANRCGARLGQETFLYHLSQKGLYSAEADHAHGPPHEIGLTEDQIAYKEVATKFAAEKLSPFSALWDEKKIFDLDTLREAAQLGFGAVYVREDVGGTGLGRADAAVIFEALSYGDISLTAYLTIHNMASHLYSSTYLRYGLGLRS